MNTMTFHEANLRYFTEEEFLAVCAEKDRQFEEEIKQIEKKTKQFKEEIKQIEEKKIKQIEEETQIIKLAIEVMLRNNVPLVEIEEAFNDFLELEKIKELIKQQTM